MKNKKVAGQLIEALKYYGIHAHVFHKATTGSVYVRFDNANIGSVRIGDHDGREKYRYRFNLRQDLTECKTENDNGIERYYFPAADIKSAVQAILKRNEAVSHLPKREYSFTK